MDITNHDIEEIDILKTILKKIDEMKQGEEESVYTSIYENQPFILSMMMGYESNVDEEVLEEEQFNAIRDMLFIIFLFFEQKTDITRKQITEAEFTNQFQLNVDFLNYLEGEEDLDAKLELTESNLSKMRFKSLYTSITFISNEDKHFQRMDDEYKAATFLEMKTLIECMEANLLEE